MKINLIGEGAFKHYEGCRQIFYHENARAFAEVNIGQSAGQFALAWRSNLVTPVIIADKGLIWIGVDQKVVAIEEHTGRICFAMTLLTNLVDIIAGDDVIVLACDSHIIALNSDSSIRSIHDASDGIEDAKLNGTSLGIYNV